MPYGHNEALACWLLMTGVLLPLGLIALIAAATDTAARWRAFAWRVKRWIWEGKPGLAACASLLAPVVCACLFARTEEAAEYWLVGSGLASELLGTFTVVRGLLSRLEEHGEPSIRARVLAWWKRRPRLEPTVYVLKVNPASVELGTGTATLTNLTPTLESRLAALEASFKEEKTANRESFKEIRGELKGLKRLHAGQGEQLKELAVGGIGRELTGLVLVLSGLTYATAGEWIARWLW